MGDDYIKITVSEPQKVEESSLTSYVTYKVSTDTNRIGFSYSTVSVVRRFSDFVWLAEMLTITCAGCIIPSLPDKTITSKFDFGPEFIEARKRSLERFLHRVADHPELGVSDHFMVFLQADEPGLKQAISLSKNLKPKRLSAASELAKSTWNMYVGNSGKSATLEKSPEDMQVDEIFGYIIDLEKIMTKTSAAAANIVSRTRKLAHSYNEFGTALTNLGLCEGDTFGEKLSKVGETMDAASTGTNMHAESEELRFQEPLEEYARLVQSVKNAVSVRNEKRGDYVNCLTNLEVDQAAYSKVLGQAGKESSARAKEEAVEKSQTKANQAKDDFEQTTKRLLRDFEQFRKTKVGDIKEILISFVSLQIEFDTKLEREWGAMSPIVNSIDSEGGASNADDGVRYTENPLPPKAPAADGDNPFADEEESV